jgi:hypothetical protein
LWALAVIARRRRSIPHFLRRYGLLHFARNDERKKAGIAPGLLVSWLAGSSPAITMLLAQFEARFGGEAGHDLIRAS